MGELTVEETQQIEKSKHGQEMEIHLAEDFLLVQVREAFSRQSFRRGSSGDLCELLVAALSPRCWSDGVDIVIGVDGLAILRLGDVWLSSRVVALDSHDVSLLCFGESYV